MKLNLEKDWQGATLFAEAYADTLPRAEPIVGRVMDPEPMIGRAMDIGVIPGSVMRVRRARRGATTTYTPGPFRHRITRHGTWTAYMVTTILSHDNTRDAEAAHRESGLYPAKSLDWNWMFKNQYITKVQS